LCERNGLSRQLSLQRIKFEHLEKQPSNELV